MDTKRFSRVLKYTSLLFLSVFIVTTAVVAEAQEQQKYSYKNQDKRDPFIPLVSPSGYLLNFETDKASSLSLEGILYDPSGDSIAIINGELLRVGDSIGTAVVVKIEPNIVTVLKDNEKLELELRREE